MKLAEDIYEDILDNMYEGLYLVDRQKNYLLEPGSGKNHRVFER